MAVSNIGQLRPTYGCECWFPSGFQQCKLAPFMWIVACWGIRQIKWYEGEQGSLHKFPRKHNRPPPQLLSLDDSSVISLDISLKLREGISNRNLTQKHPLTFVCGMISSLINKGEHHASPWQLWLCQGIPQNAVEVSVYIICIQE